jgi:hypothetical protein
VEAAAQDDAILLRRSVDLDGPVLAFTTAAWRDLTARIKQTPPRTPSRDTTPGQPHLHLTDPPVTTVGIS